MTTQQQNDDLQALRARLKGGEYNGADIMAAWLALDELRDARRKLAYATDSVALQTLRDYTERSTHWQEGGATRHDAMVALAALDLDMPTPYKREATQLAAPSDAALYATTSERTSPDWHSGFQAGLAAGNACAAARQPEQPADSEFIEVPVMGTFDNRQPPIGMLRVRAAALPPAATFCFALGFQATATHASHRSEVADYRMCP